MSNSYVIQNCDSARDYSSANRFGAIHFLLEKNDSVLQTPGPIYFKLKRVLAQFKPDDYLVFAGGDPWAVGMVFAILRDYNFKEVNVLRWNRNRQLDGTIVSGFYTPVKIKIGD